MWPLLAVSLVAASLAAKAPVSFLQKRNALKASVKESHISSFEHDFTKHEKDMDIGQADKLAISDKSYKLLAKLRNDTAMETFIRRILLTHGKTINDDGAFKGFVPWFSGTKATQSLKTMKRQLFKQPWVVDASDRPIKSLPAGEEVASKNMHAPYRSADQNQTLWVHANEFEHQAHGTQLSIVSAQVNETNRTYQALLKAVKTDIVNSFSSAKSATTIGHHNMAAPVLQASTAAPVHLSSPAAAPHGQHDLHNDSAAEEVARLRKATPFANGTYQGPPSPSSANMLKQIGVASTSPLPEPSPVHFATKPHYAEETHGGNASRYEAKGNPTATPPAVNNENRVAVPSPSSSAALPVAATRHGSVETPLATEELLFGVQSFVDAQSQIVNDITSKIVELKANAGKAESSIRDGLDEANALYRRKLLEQHMNTTRLDNMNAHLEEDVKALVSGNTKLRKHAQELKMQSLALREQVIAVESNLTLAQEFAAKALFDDSSDDFQFLEELKRNESEVAKAYSHSLALDRFVEKNPMALLKREDNIESADLLHILVNTFSKLSAQANVSKLALEQDFEQRFSQEALAQESILAKQKALLAEKQKQLELRSELTASIAHAEKIKTYLGDRLLHLRSYALRLSRQYS